MAQVSMQSVSPDEPLPDNNPALMYTSPESQHSSDRSPLSNFGFLKNLGLDKKQTKGRRTLTNFAANLLSLTQIQMEQPQNDAGPSPTANLL
jgi:hypothetical protein